MIEICAIASGSNGNCYYIGNNTDAILIDAGISCKQILLRMAQQNLDTKKIRAVFVTHEHNDHSCGLRVLCSKLNITAYLTAGTLNAIPIKNRPLISVKIHANQTVNVGSLSVTAFPKNHDASQPCSFTVVNKSHVVSVITDLGAECEHVINNINKCTVLLIEANYDEKMLKNGSYPVVLQKRIEGKHGHLSNKQAFEIVKKYASENLHTIMLCHLSGQNNTIDKAMNEFVPLTALYTILPTCRHHASQVVKI